MMLIMGNGVKTSLVLSTVAVLLSACQSVRVERWVEVPCQPHGFYIAFKGQTLADVAQACRVDEAMLIKYNTWLTTRQPFTEHTLVWLKADPTKAPEEENLQLGSIEATGKKAIQTESLQPLFLPMGTSKNPMGRKSEGRGYEK
jgi:hypothetical protein